MLGGGGLGAIGYFPFRTDEHHVFVGLRSHSLTLFIIIIITIFTLSVSPPPRRKASSEGQKIFDKLLKACNEVEWVGESILVLKEICVDPPYAADNCSLINNRNGGGGLDVHSLERVKKIVSAAKS
jgi:hypothetical protein